MECQPSSSSAKGSSWEYISVGWNACLGEKRNCETFVEMVLVMLVVESEVSDWVGGSDFTQDMHCDPELAEDGGLGAGDVRP